MKKNDAIKLMLDDLARSGLTEEDAKIMQLKALLPEEMNRIYPGVKVCAYEIPYFDEDGNPTGYSRYKLLEDYTPKGDKKPIKYLQLPSTTPRFYLPQFPSIDWKKVCVDYTISIYLVEGEKKAAALCKLGYMGIGMGGVWAWRTKNNDE